MKLYCSNNKIILITMKLCCWNHWIFRETFLFFQKTFLFVTSEWKIWMVRPRSKDWNFECLNARLINILAPTEKMGAAIQIQHVCHCVPIHQAMRRSHCRLSYGDDFWTTVHISSKQDNVLNINIYRIQINKPHVSELFWWWDRSITRIRHCFERNLQEFHDLIHSLIR